MLSISHSSHFICLFANEFGVGSSMTRSFKRNMWRAGSGDGHHMEQREFHGGSAAATHNDQLWSHLSQPVSFATNRGCSISTVQKNLRETADNSFHLISCTAFWIWMNLVQVWQDLSRETCEEQEVEMDIIWNKENFMAARRPPHTTTSSEAIYLSPCQLCNQQRLFNLDAPEKLAWDRRQFFPFHKLHGVLNLDEFGSSMTRSCKRNMWRAGSGDGHHMEQREFHGGSAAATHNDQLWSHLSQPVSALQPTEAVQFGRDRKTCVRPTSLSIFIGCTAFWIWMNLVQVRQDLSKETCEEQEVEMDIIWNEENFMEARRPPHGDKLQCHLSQSMSACNSAVAPLIWTARESDRGGVGCWISTLQWTSVTPAFNSGFHRFALGYDRSV